MKIIHARKTTSASPEEKPGEDDSVDIPLRACLTVALSSSFPVKKAVSTITNPQIIRGFFLEIISRTRLAVQFFVRYTSHNQR